MPIKVLQYTSCMKIASINNDSYHRWSPSSVSGECCRVGHQWIGASRIICCRTFDDDLSGER